MKKFFCKKVNVLMWHLVLMAAMLMTAIVSSVVTKQEQDEQIKQLQQENRKLEHNQGSKQDQHWNDMQGRMREVVE